MAVDTIEDGAKWWENYVTAKKALLSAEVVRSYRTAEADFAEWLVKVALGGQLAQSKVNAGFDVVAGNKRVQVKSLAKSPGNSNGYIITSKDRGNNPDVGATHYAFVFFDDLIPCAILLVPESFVRSFPRTQIKRSDLEVRDFKVRADLSHFHANDKDTASGNTSMGEFLSMAREFRGKLKQKYGVFSGQLLDEEMRHAREELS